MKKKITAKPARGKAAGKSAAKKPLSKSGAANLQKAKADNVFLKLKHNVTTLTCKECQGVFYQTSEGDTHTDVLICQGCGRKVRVNIRPTPGHMVI